VLDELARALEFRPAAPPTPRIWRRGVVLVPMWGGPVVARRRLAAARPPLDRSEAAGSPAAA
jgi:hypothetical protein